LFLFRFILNNTNIRKLFQLIQIFADEYRVFKGPRMADNTVNNEDISKLGEFPLIRYLTRNISLKNRSTLFGVGDDAAILDYSKKKAVLTTDLLTEGIHFNLVYTPLKHLGYKAAVVNFSDIYAMNAHPRQIVIAIAVSRKFTTSMIDEVYSGIYLACNNYGVDVVGGDTSSSLTGMTITITAVGEAEEQDLTYRHGAKVNDLICVSGDLGGAYMGLQLLEREKKIFEKDISIQPDLEGYKYILERQLKPEARKDIIELLKKLGIKPASMIDISDGLSSELFHICNESKTGCKIFADKIPVNPETVKMAEEFNMEPLVAALNGGEDYELLFTVPLSAFDKMAGHPQISVIGHITEINEGKTMITVDGSSMELKSMGWDSLK
jgi:thiamine-monophosphate kinase